MNKAAVISAIIDAIQSGFETLHSTSQKTRAGGNDSESKSEGKYDTRSTEDNYLADGLARQALASANAGAAYRDFKPKSFGRGSPVNLGALVLVGFSGEQHWFFLGPAGGGIAVNFEGVEITVLTIDSPLARQLAGKKVGASITSPKAKILAVE